MSVQNNNPSIRLTPVIRYCSLKFKTVSVGLRPPLETLITWYTVSLVTVLKETIKSIFPVGLPANEESVTNQ